MMPSTPQRMVLSWRAKAVAGAISTHMDGNGRTIRPSIDLLAADSGLASRTVATALAELRAVRWRSYALVAVVFVATACANGDENGGEAIRTGPTSDAATVTTTSGSLPSLRSGDEVEDLGSGVTFRVPEGWEADSRTGLALAGLPANRELDYTNVLVVTHVDNGKGKIIPLPAEWSDWLRARRDLSVRRVGPVTVDGKTGTIIHVANRKDEVAVFCSGNVPDLCFSPGRGGVDYASVDLEPEKLLLIEGPSPARVRELAKFVELS